MMSENATMLYLRVLKPLPCLTSEKWKRARTLQERKQKKPTEENVFTLVNLRVALMVSPKHYLMTSLTVYLIVSSCSKNNQVKYKQYWFFYLKGSGGDILLERRDFWWRSVAWKSDPRLCSETEFLLRFVVCKMKTEEMKRGINREEEREAGGGQRWHVASSDLFLERATRHDSSKS